MRRAPKRLSERLKEAETAIRRRTAIAARPQAGQASSGTGKGAPVKLPR